MPSLPRLFGPVMYYDMVRQARRGRFILARFLYASSLVAMLALACQYVSGQTIGWPAPVINIHDGASIAKSYFLDFMAVQFLALITLTPAYVAGAISEERQRRTLDLMFATQLHDREIVLDKLGSRVGNLLLFAITGLPILGILQFLGGIDPNLILASFAIAVFTILSHSGVSILCSTLWSKPRHSIGAAYLAIASFYVLAFILSQAFEPNPIPTRNPKLTPALVAVFNKGSMFAVISQTETAGTAGSLAQQLPSLVIDFAIFHSVIALADIGAAIYGLRRGEFVRTAFRPIRASTSQPGWGPELLESGFYSIDQLASIPLPSTRPPIGPNPLLWKELHRKIGKWSPWWTRGILAAGVVVATVTLRLSIQSSERGWSGLPSDFGPVAQWVRYANLIVGLLTLLIVGVRAASTIATERQNRTWDSLLTTPLSSASMVNNFWLASLWSGRFGLAFLGLIWFVAFATTMFDATGVLFLMLIWLIYANFATTLGLFASLNSRSSLAAIGRTIVVLVGIIIVHWMLWGHYMPLVGRGFGGDSVRDAVLCCLLAPQALMISLIGDSRSVDQTSGLFAAGWDYFVCFFIFAAVLWVAAAEALRTATIGRIQKMRSARRGARVDFLNRLFGGKKSPTRSSPNFAYASGSARSPSEPEA